MYAALIFHPTSQEHRVAAARTQRMAADSKAVRQTKPPTGLLTGKRSKHLIDNSTFR